MSTDDDDPDERLMDWGLGERLGGARPPDLVDAVRSKLARDGAGAPVPVRASSRWLAAACVLLGVGAVFGVAMWPERAADPVPALPGPVQEPPRAQVNSVADVAALPAGTRAVEAIGVGDDVIAALTRLRDLEVLVVREPWNESFGLSLKMQAPANPQQITEASWPHFAQFTKLRRLELSGTVKISSGGSAPDGVAMLERLPLLEHLSLRFLDTSDAALARLPRLRNLRSLDLSFNHAFGANGIRALLECRSLRVLSLRGCQQLQGAWLVSLREVPELEELDLSLIDGMNWRDGRVFFDDGKTLRRVVAQGPTDAALAALAKSPKLRVLDISSGTWSSAGLNALGACSTLRELDACGGGDSSHDFVAVLPRELERLEVCGDYTDAFCAAVREHLTALRHVCVAACYKITDAGLAELCAMPSLRVVDMRQMRGLTAASVDTLSAAQQLVQLDLRHCDFVTAQHVVRLRRALPKLAKIQSNFTDEQIAAADTLPDPIQVRTKEAIYALPADTRNVVAFDVDDHCMPYFKRLRSLERLEITAAWAWPGMRKVVPQVRSITDDGLRQIANLPALRILKLGGELEVKGPGLDVLGALPSLEHLALELMKVDDAGLAHVAKAPRLHTLQLHHTQGFGALTFDAIAQLRELRELSLQGCVHVEDSWLAKVAALPRLEQLDLGMIGSRTHFSGWGGPLPPAEPGSGVTDRVLELLGQATSLRELCLSYAGITGEGLRHLQGLPRLASVDLTGTPVTANDLRWLPPGVERLTLRNCTQLGQDFGRPLAGATPRLRILDLQSCSELTDACLPGLRELKALRNLDLSYCAKFTANAADGIVALEQLEELTLRGWPGTDDPNKDAGRQNVERVARELRQALDRRRADVQGSQEGQRFGEEQWKRVRAMPNLKRLDTDQGSERLR